MKFLQKMCERIPLISTLWRGDIESGFAQLSLLLSNAQDSKKLNWSKGLNVFYQTQASIHGGFFLCSNLGSNVHRFRVTDFCFCNFSCTLLSLFILVMTLNLNIFCTFYTTRKAITLERGYNKRPSTITKTSRQPYPSYMQIFIKIRGGFWRKVLTR